MSGKNSIDFQAVKDAAAGRWNEILPALTPLSGDVLRRGAQDHPCPLCNGESVIWPAKDSEQSGSIACRKCTDNKPTGDGIATVAKWAGLSQIDAAKAIASHLGIDGESTRVELDVIELVCKDKRMPIEAFNRFNPTIEKRGRNRNQVARVAVYNERGETHSYFDFAPGYKGWFERGEGKQGMFFPGRLPQAGETWHLVEGCKDAAALIGLGYDAAGLPTSCMADKYAKLFAGVHIVLVPDLDTAGQDGAQKTGGRLTGIASSVRVARLPGEIVEKGGDDVRDVLARKDGEKLVRDAIAQADQWHPRDGEYDPKEGRPEVLVTLAYGWCVDQVTEHLGKLGWESPWIPQEKRDKLKIYQRGDTLVQVVVTDEHEQLQGVDIPEGTARIRPLPTAQLPLRIADACQLMQEKETEGEVERVAVPPQRWLVDGIATRGDWGRYVKRLSGVITAPTIRTDGTILQQPGYDAMTGLLFLSNIKFPQIPDKPSQDDAKKAVNELLEVILDFPFVDDADRSAWLSLVLTEIGRAAISGCCPLFAITATTRGSGKSILADAASLIAYGRTAPRKTFSGDDNETRKVITAVAIEALPSVLLDNVDCVLGGASLDAAITAVTWSDRVLGASKTTGELPLRTVWTATGNNLRFGSDLARRVLPIRLAPQIENPEERTDFKHADLLGWVADNRPRMAVAALTVLRAYIVAGRPQQPSGAWGSFEAWSSLVRGALVWAGQADPLKTRQTAKADDTSASIVRGLIGGLIEVDETGNGVTVRQIVTALNDADENRFTTLREVVSEVATTRGLVDGKRLTYVFRKYKGRVAKGFKISGETGHGGVVRWSAIRVSGEDGDHSDHETGYPACETLCVTNNTHATHMVADGNGLKSSPSSSPSSPSRESGGDNDIVI